MNNRIKILNGLTFLILVLSVSCQNTNKIIPKAALTFVHLELNEWHINFLEDSSTDYYFNTPRVGNLTFTLIKDSSVKIYYDVYDTVYINERFKTKELELKIMSSCFSFVTEPRSFVSFSIDEFYYQLAPCNSCKPKDSTECNSLSKQLLMLAI